MKTVENMKTIRDYYLFVGVTFVLLVLAPSFARCDESTPQQLEFFEKKIRPVLVEHCYQCHSTTSKKLKGELLLDSKWGWEQGGESGPVIVPGKPNESRIISALNYVELEMPPKGKLPETVVADFIEWIRMGAHDPREKKTRESATADSFDLAERKDWWSLKPVRQVAVPEVKRKDWARNDADRFVLAALEKKGWEPAAHASRNSWIRRVTYDLTGLPPTPQAVQAFVDDDTVEAYEKVVDRLLKSEHFGEQWARHWMDLVRYAETKAFEADYAMPNVYQYRDYLIRAFNEDVSYNQLLKEAIAGDLIKPRLNPASGINESVIGPGYLYLTDGQHGPPDVHADEARIFDDMIDVVGKAFLSQTVACARCHDHKFDAITTRDYYSLYGLIASSRIDYANINPPAKQESWRAKLREQKQTVRQTLADVLIADMKQVRADLQASRDGKAATPQQQRWADVIQKKPNNVAKSLAGLLTAKDTAAIAATWNANKQEPTANADSLGKISRDSFGQWLTSGRSFEKAPRPAGDFIVPPTGDKVIATFVGGRPAAGHLGSRFAGSIKSPTFRIEGNSVAVRVKGKNVRVNLYVRHYELVGRGPTTGGTTKVINKDQWETINFRTNLWVGETAYIEVQQNGGQINFNWATGNHADGAYAVLDTAANNKPLAPLPLSGPAWGIVGDAPQQSDGALEHLANQIEQAASNWKSGKLTIVQSDLLEGLYDAGAFDFTLGRSEELKQAVEQFRVTQLEVPKPSYVRTLSDGHGEDEPVYIRGSHRNLSTDANPRHFLDGIDGKPFNAAGSGRLQWAESLVAGDNPLTARVFANRIWHHLFGRGIVASVDDFGHMGEQPSHPELLDHLANRFVKNDWSVKSLVRELVLSNTYRMSSAASEGALRDDPNNVLLQHMPIRRLQAESIRDTLLAVSGQLDPRLFGPSQGGDGGNRRSVYIQLRRRFMPDFLMTFDMPNATETFGRRNITAGPTQSLALMNGPISWKAAEKWAQQIMKQGNTFEERIDLLHQQAFARKATDRELKWARALLADLAADEKSISHQHWKEICHTMLNRKELIYVY
jgi:hypothetical protein